MTSLEKQLKRLKTPQTEAFRQQKYKPSFLYDKKDAGAIDFDTHLRIARRGFKKLTKLNPELENFEYLFEEPARDLDRSVLQKDDNDHLSQVIRKYLHNAVVPYFMLNDCHETLEFLIYKYQVHAYQTDDFICSILPYHETRLFARALQVIDNLVDKPLWSWLEPYKNEGVPVPKERILSILSNRHKLPLVALLGDKLIEINRDSKQAGLYTSFWTTTIMCILERDLDENFYVAFMPHVYKAIKKSNNIDLFMAGLALIGYLAYTQELDESYMEKLLERIEKTHAKLREKEKDKVEVLDEYYEKVFQIISPLGVKSGGKK